MAKRFVSKNRKIFRTKSSRGKEEEGKQPNADNSGGNPEQSPSAGNESGEKKRVQPDPKGEETVSVGKTPIATKFFKSLWSFDKFVNQQIESGMLHNQRLWESERREWKRMVSRKPDWYGTPVPTDISELENHDTFENFPLYKKKKKELKNLLKQARKLKSRHEIPSKKIAYNARQLGIFSFDRAAVGLKKTRTKDGEIKIVTDVRTVYAYHQNKQNEQQAVKIYLKAGAASNITGDEMINVGIGAGLLVEELVKLGYQVEVNLAIGGRNIDQEKKYNKGHIAFIRLKSFEGNLKLNDLLVLSGSPRYFRYRGFKGIIALNDWNGLECDSGLNYPIQPSQFKMIVNQMESKSKGRHFVFGDTYSESGIIEEIQSIIDQIKNK